MDKRKQKVFKIMAMVFPVAIICLFELILRLTGYGYDTALFVKDPDDKTSWMMNPYASYKFFSDPANATRGFHERFKIQKEPNALRIFVLGESTTAGYPYMHNGAFHRWLQYRLMHTFPNRKFEIINLSLTAVNSYTVLDFGKQLVNYQPDAVLVYTGHNEYYGALGIGSTSQINGSRFWIMTVLKLRQFRVVQAIVNVINKIQYLGRAPTDTRENLMKRMAANQGIIYNSEDYYKGIEQFKQNMSELCSVLSAKQIPLVISNLVSNEKDLKPFVSANGQYSANEAYQTAISALQNKEPDKAKAGYRKASEYDLLRFRAPRAMNIVIKELVHKYPGVYLANTRKFFEDNSAAGILGNETLLEHVHPNLYGYALMSEAFYQALNTAQLIKPNKGKAMSFQQLLKQMPVTGVDSLYGAYQIMMLKTGWPFNHPIPKSYKRGNTINEQLAGALAVDRITWTEAMDQLFKYSMKAGDKQQALKATEAVLLEQPENLNYYIYAGRLNFELGNKSEASFYFEKAYQLESSKANAQNNYLLCLKLDEPQKALTYLNIMRNFNSDVAGIDRAEELINTIVKLKNQITTTPDKQVLKSQIANIYHQLNADEAAKVYNTKLTH